MTRGSSLWGDSWEKVDTNCSLNYDNPFKLEN